MRLWQPGAVCLLLATAVGCCGDREAEQAKDATEAAQPPGVPPPGDAFRPMTDSGYRVKWGAPSVPCSLKPGVSVPVSVVVKNVSDQTWPDIPTSDQGKGRGAVRLVYRWWKSPGDKEPLIDYGAPRGDLSGPVSPGGDATLTVTVEAPPQAGSYVLQLELVAELVHWFADRGADKLLVPVSVS
jgi:hypothetical protein